MQTKYSDIPISELAEIILQDVEELRQLLNEKECLLQVFQALNAIQEQDLEYVISEVEEILTEVMTGFVVRWSEHVSLVSGEQSADEKPAEKENAGDLRQQSLLIEIMRFACRAYPHMSVSRNQVRSVFLAYTFHISEASEQAKRNPLLIVQIMSIKFLERVFIVHRNDADISNILSEYVKFVENNIEFGNLSVITAMLNISTCIIEYYLQDIISLLIRLATYQIAKTKGKATARWKLRDKSIKKTVKNALCAALKTHNFDEKISFGIMDCLTNNLGISKSDSYQLSQILSTRGLNYQDSAPQLQLTNEQISTAIVAALHHYANTTHANIAPFVLPSDVTLSVHVVTEILMVALGSFNPNNQPDGGLQHWSQIISSIQLFTQQALQIQIQHLSQVASVMDTSHASAVSKFITHTQPFILAPISLQNVKDIIKKVLNSFLDYLETVEQNGIPKDVEPMKIIEFDGSANFVRMHTKKRKRPSSDIIEDSFYGEHEIRGSRAFYSIVVARLFAASTFQGYRDIFIEWVLADFTRRWDMALRWLWESWYNDHVSSKNAGEDCLYNNNLTYLMRVLFELAEKATPGMDLTFIPWIVNHATIFRKFLLMLPRTAGDSHVLTLLRNYLDIEFTEPSPTPIENLKFNMSLEILFDLITQRPAYRKFLPEILCYLFSTDPKKRALCVKCVKKWWETDSSRALEFGFSSEGFFVPLYELLENFGLLLIDSLVQKKFDLAVFEKSGSHTVTRLITETFSKIKGMDEILDENSAWPLFVINGSLQYYFSLVTRKPELIRRLISVLPYAENEMVISVISDSMVSFLSSFGIPKDMDEISYKMIQHLLVCFQNPKLTRLHKVIIRTIKTLTNYPPDPETAQQFTSPSYVFTRLVVETIKANHHIEAADLWGCIISGDGLSRQETFMAIYMLAKYLVKPHEPGNCELFVYIAKEILKPPAVLSPVEFLIFVNNLFDLAPFGFSAAKFPLLKKEQCVQVLKLFISSSISPFNNRSLSASITLMMSNYSTGISYPLLFMDTVIEYSLHYRQEVYGFILSQVLAPCCNLKMMWNAAKDRVFIKSDEGQAAKSLWKSFIKSLEICSPSSFVLIIQLQKDRLTLVLENLDATTHKMFREWCIQEKSGLRSKKVEAVLDIIDSMQKKKI